MATDKVSDPTEVDAIVVGAGAAGLYAAYRLRRAGVDFQGIETAEGIGGTWFWNRYPGCRCDIPTIEYSYSFDEELEQEWSFPETMSTQPEIERYLNHVAERHDLRRHFLFNTRVTSATFDEGSLRWRVETDTGLRFDARWCVMATGSLSAPNIPDIPGVAEFKGTVVHTGLWPREGIDVTGLRVGVIGTGSSAVQSIPHLARGASQLTVFQRTPGYSFPANVTPTDPDFESHVKSHYRELREMQRSSPKGLSGFARTNVEGIQAVGGGALADAHTFAGAETQARTQAFFADMVRQRVHDPEVAASLIPTDYPVGCKRIILEIDYFETYNRDNVRLIDLRKCGIVEVTDSGVQTEEGHIELDVLVFATGFDALTGPLTRIEIRGPGGLRLRDVWADGPRAYLGLVASGFPNLFIITGPGSPSVVTNMMVSIEQHVDLVTEMITRFQRTGVLAVDADPEAESAWLVHVDEVGEGTPYTHPACNSWYLGSNIEGKRRALLPYLGGFNRYRSICDDVLADGCRGFRLTSSPIEAAAPN
jgi:cyclohexanone monooxygenase